MYAYVINLARSADRRAHMERQLKNIGAQYEISEAAEAEELNLSDERLFDPVLVRNSWYRPAMAACALSHLRVYRQVLENGHEVALVLEDDTLLPADLSALTAATLHRAEDVHCRPDCQSLRRTSTLTARREH